MFIYSLNWARVFTAFALLALRTSAFAPVVCPGTSLIRLRDTGSAENVPQDSIILGPFSPAADPKYAVSCRIGDKEFVVSREGGPTEEELTNENILKIVTMECSDLEVRNTLFAIARIRQRYTLMFFPLA
jgi:hypothetical protein